jgi:hypothetical protein
VTHQILKERGSSKDPSPKGGGEKVAHQAVDEIGGELLSFDGEMRIETGGRRGTVTEVLLNETKVDACLQ